MSWISVAVLFGNHGVWVWVWDLLTTTFLSPCDVSFLVEAPNGGIEDAKGSLSDILFQTEETSKLKLPSCVIRSFATTESDDARFDMCVGQNFGIAVNIQKIFA